MDRANLSGKLLENRVEKIFHDIFDCSIRSRGNLEECCFCDELHSNLCYPQFKLSDIFGVSRCDFKVIYNSKIYFFELKNQQVSGSVDQKLPYYIENIKENV